MKAADAKKFIGKTVSYRKQGRLHPTTDVVVDVIGRNIITECDALWAPDIADMHLVEEVTSTNKE